MFSTPSFTVTQGGGADGLDRHLNDKMLPGLHHLLEIAFFFKFDYQQLLDQIFSANLLISVAGLRISTFSTIPFALN